MVTTVKQKKKRSENTYLHTERKTHKKQKCNSKFNLSHESFCKKK